MVPSRPIVIAVLLIVLIGMGSIPSLGTVGPTGDAHDPVPQSLTGDGSNRTYIPAEIETFQEVTTRDLDDRITSVDWSPNGSFLAVGAYASYGGGEFRLYSFNGTDLMTVISWSLSGYVFAVAWNPNGSYLAFNAGSQGNNMKIYSFNGTALTEVASNHHGWVSKFAWSPDGKFLAAIGSNRPDDFAIYSFNGTALTMVDSRYVRYGGYDVSWDPEGTRLAITWFARVSTHPDFPIIGKLTILSFNGSSLRTELEYTLGKETLGLDWSPDGDYIAIGYDEGYGAWPLEVYYIYEDRYGRTAMTLSDSYDHQGPQMAVSWSPNGGYIAVAGQSTGDDCRISSFNGSDLSTEHSWSFGDGWRFSISWSSDGKYMAIGGEDDPRDLKVYRIEHGPLAYIDTAVMDEDTTMTLDVLANDRTTSGDLTITNITPAPHGLVEITPDGRDLVYTPPANWSGEVNFTYRHSDMLNESSRATVSITVLPVNDVPVISTKDVVEATEDEPYSVRYNATDADPGDVLSWTVELGAEWLDFNETTGILSGLPTNEDVGSCIVRITVTDINVTSDSTSFLLTVMNVNDDPVITTDDVTTVDEDDLYSVYYKAEDIDPTDDILEWSLDTEADWLSIYDNHIMGTPTNDDVGDHVVNITVSDGNGGSEWSKFTIKVFNVNDPPIILTKVVSVATEDEEYNLTFETEDVDVGDVMGWSMTGPGWLVINGGAGVLAGIPTNDDVGTHFVTVTASDGGLEDSVYFAITVANVNDAPVWVETPGDQELMEGDVMFLDVLAEDEDGDSLTYEISSKPGSSITITATSGAIRWLEAEPGTYECEVTTTDGTETISHEFTVTVEAEPEPPVPPPPPPPNKVPVIQEVGEVNVTAGEAFHLQLVGSDGDDWDIVNLTWTLVNAPEGMVITADGEILWLPDDKTVGVRFVTAELTDGKGKATVDFEVEVLEAVVDDGDTSDVEDGGDYLWLVVALVVVVLLLVAIMLWMYMGQREPPMVDTAQKDVEVEDDDLEDDESEDNG